jgi:hypothetical protein
LTSLRQLVQNQYRLPDIKEVKEVIVGLKVN